MPGILLEGGGVLEKIVGVVPQILSLGNQCFSALADNELTLTYLGVTFVGVGFSIVGMMIHAARKGR